jgi:hypothetical protein
MCQEIPTDQLPSRPIGPFFDSMRFGRICSKLDVVVVVLGARKYTAPSSVGSVNGGALDSKPALETSCL